MNWYSRFNDSKAQTDVLPGNGSNRTTITGIDQKTGTLDIEEGARFTAVSGRTNGNVKVQKFCWRTNLDGLDGDNPSGYGLLVNQSAHTRWRGVKTAQQPTIQYNTADFFTAHPTATLAQQRTEAGAYYDGLNFRILPGSSILSTANNSLEIYVTQTISADGVEVQGVSGGALNYTAGSAFPAFVGSVRRAYDGNPVRPALLSARPTYLAPNDLDRRPDSVNGKNWAPLLRNEKTVAGGSGTQLTVNNVGTQGGVQVGDAVEIYSENGASHLWHRTTVTAITDNVMTLNNPYPSGYTAVTANGGSARFGRWA